MRSIFSFTKQELIPSFEGIWMGGLWFLFIKIKFNVTVHSRASEEINYFLYFLELLIQF